MSGNLLGLILVAIGAFVLYLGKSGHYVAFVRALAKQ